MNKIITIIILLLSGSLIAQQKSVEYIDLKPDFFKNYAIPTGIVIFPFKHGDQTTEVDQLFFSQLVSSLGKQSRFIINYHKKLESLRNSWGISSWDVKNLQLLKKLNAELDIKLVIIADLYDQKGSSFELRIVNTSNGKDEFKQKYLTTEKSSAMDDAIILFTKSQNVKYNLPRETGTLVVKTIPEGNFTAWVGNYKGETPLKLNNLKSGEYTITIIDEMGTYQNHVENFKFLPISDAAIEKIIVLNTNLGSLQLAIIPSDALIELIDGIGKQIKKGKQIRQIDSLQSGDYKLIVSAPGFIEETFLLNIEEGKTAVKVINLLPESSKRFFVEKVTAGSDEIKSASLSRDGNKYVLKFDIVGDPKDDFLVEAFLKDSNIPGFEKKLTKLSGVYGEGKFAGKDRTMVWDFEKEFPSGIESKSLYLFLVADKKGGGIPWYVWIGGLTAGGAAAYFILTNQNEKEAPGSVNIPNPPIRP